MKIAVVGSGYVGLVAGACLAENGNDVVCIDRDPAKIKLLQRGKIPIYEPGLEEMVRKNREEKRLTFTTNLPRGAKSAQIIFIAVGTPTGEDGSADLLHVLGVARELGQAVDAGAEVRGRAVLAVPVLIDGAVAQPEVRGEVDHVGCDPCDETRSAEPRDEGDKRP